MDNNNSRVSVVLKLRLNSLSNTWLINRLEERGIRMTSYNLSDILRGVRRNEDSDRIIMESLDILNSYEKWHADELQKATNKDLSEEGKI